MRNDEKRDIFEKIMKTVCSEVELEPDLHLLEGESYEQGSTSTEYEARLDIRTNSGVPDS